MVSELGGAALADRLRLVAGRIARRLRQQSLGGLTPSQRSVLASLDRHGPLTMGRLAEVEVVSGPSVTGIISRLEEKALVSRRPNPEDRRSAIVSLTSEGRTVLEEGGRERTEFLAARLEMLSEEERERLAEAISILDRILESD